MQNMNQDSFSQPDTDKNEQQEESKAFNITEEEQADESSALIVP